MYHQPFVVAILALFDFVPVHSRRIEDVFNFKKFKPFNNMQHGNNLKCPRVLVLKLNCASGLSRGLVRFPGSPQCLSLYVWAETPYFYQLLG